MTSNAELYNMVMSKYHLSEPVSTEDQIFILRSRKKVLKAILKKYNKFSIFLWLAIVTAIIFRNMGIKLSLIQSKVILAVFLATATAGASSATYAGAKYIYKQFILKDVNQIEETMPLKELEIDLNRDSVVPGQKTNSPSLQKEKVPEKKEETEEREKTAGNPNRQDPQEETAPNKKEHIPVVPTM